MKYKYMTSIGVIGIVIFVGVMSILTPDKETSELEGRTLQTLPSIKGNIKETLDGSFFKEWDSYFSDHIFKRDTIVNAYATIQDTLDKKYVNGVYLGEDEYVFTLNEVKGMTDSKLENSAEHFNKIADKFSNSKSYLVNLPQKSMIHEDMVPIDGFEAPENEYADEFLNYLNKDKIGVIDFRNDIKDNEELYYKTDHHWNMNGVYKAYNYIINKISKDFPQVGTPTSKDKFEVKTYKNYFVGADGRKIGQMIKSMEDISTYTHESYKDFKVYNKKGNVDIIKKDRLSTDKFNNDYGTYLGGDNSELVIENPNANNDLKIVMVGDSMDNPLIPMMAQHFSTIYSFDQRSYTGFSGDINKMVEDIKPDIIMFIGLSRNLIQGNEGELFRWNLN